MKMKCTQCGDEFDRDIPPEIVGMFTSKICGDCLNKNMSVRRAEEEMRRAEEEMRRAGKKIYKWNQFCPPAFLETEIGKLPSPATSDTVLEWKFNSRGLILYGPTRSGKTRSAWLLIKQIFMQGKTIKVMDSMAGFEYAAVFSGGAGTALDWIQSRSNCGLLFMDDVFKVKLTDSFEAALFAVVDHRMNHQLPIIATLNDTGDTLAARMTDDRGNPFIARLKEMCDTIIFK
jgi:DNA replication protein DnaC